MDNVCLENAENTCRSYPQCYGCNSFKTPTNYHKVISMGVEELAEFLSHFADGYHTPNQNKQRRKNMKDWLESEVE